MNYLPLARPLHFQFANGEVSRKQPWDDRAWVLKPGFPARGPEFCPLQLRTWGIRRLPQASLNPRTHSGPSLEHRLQMDSGSSCPGTSVRAMKKGELDRWWARSQDTVRDVKGSE